MMIEELKTLCKECRSNSCIEHAKGIIVEEKASENLSNKISTISISGTGKKVLHSLHLLSFLRNKYDFC